MFLKEFLEEHRSEAEEMSIFEYNQERHMMQEREAAWNEGHAAGEKEGRAAGEKIGRETGLQEGLRHTALNLKKMGMSDEQIAQAVDRDINTVQEWLGSDEEI